MLSEFYPNALKAVRDAEAALGVGRRYKAQSEFFLDGSVSIDQLRRLELRLSRRSMFVPSLLTFQRLANHTKPNADMDKAWGSGDPTSDIDTSDHVVFDDHGCPSLLSFFRRGVAHLPLSCRCSMDRYRPIEGRLS